jgi:two-component system, cell cycle sensor histidine kinase and response regulator CckA
MKTVLLLEDELSIMKLLRQVLRQYCLVEAATAEEALMLFIDHDHKIDLLVADLTVSIRSGIQVALLLRTRLPALPVVLTSGYPVSDWNVQDSADLERLGSNSVTILQKPFSAKVLMSAVHELLEGAPFKAARTA